MSPRRKSLLLSTLVIAGLSLRARSQSDGLRDAWDGIAERVQEAVGAMRARQALGEGAPAQESPADRMGRVLKEIREAPCGAVAVLRFKNVLVVSLLPKEVRRDDLFYDQETNTVVAAARESKRPIMIVHANLPLPNPQDPPAKQGRDLDEATAMIDAAIARMRKDGALDCRGTGI